MMEGERRVANISYSHRDDGTIWMHGDSYDLTKERDLERFITNIYTRSFRAGRDKKRDDILRSLGIGMFGRDVRGLGE